MKRVYVNEEYCVGCGLCQVHCITVHSSYKKNIIKAFKKSDPRPVSRVIVEENRPLSFSLQCRHCAEANCVKSCITGAMQKDPATGVVTNDESRCVGCWTCILTCPHGAIIKDESGKKVAAKCDMCSGLAGIPVCVENCPNGALEYRETNKKQA